MFLSITRKSVKLKVYHFTIELTIKLDSLHNNLNRIDQTSHPLRSWLWIIPIVVVDSRNSLPEHFMWDLFYYEWDFQPPPFWKQRQWWASWNNMFYSIPETNNKQLSTSAESGTWNFNFCLLLCFMRIEWASHLALFHIWFILFRATRLAADFRTDGIVCDA